MPWPSIMNDKPNLQLWSKETLDDLEDLQLPIIEWLKYP